MGHANRAGTPDFTAWVEKESYELTIRDRPLRFTLWAWSANVRRVECNTCDWEFFSNTKDRKWDDTDGPEHDIIDTHYQQAHQAHWDWYMRRPGVAEAYAARQVWIAEHNPPPPEAPTIGAPITDYAEQELF